MLFNKNNVRKVNDRKVLHKVGKNWKVVSLALLMAIGSGAVATHANANAAANANSNNDEYLDIQGSKYINSGYTAPSSTASSDNNQPAKPASSNDISYLSGYNGSAASYHAKAQSDEANYQSNQNIVNSYVNSINTNFPNETNSLNSNYNSISAKTNGDQASAQSYSAIAAQSNYSSQVTSLASKAGLTYSGYVQSVSFSATSFANAVSNGASTVSEMNVVNSYAQLINNINNNGALKSEYAAKYYAGSDALSVDQAYASNAQNLYNGLVNNSGANDTNLTTATEKSAANSAAEQIAHINSGLDANTTNSLASALGYGTNSSATSSETSANASNMSSITDGSYVYHNVHGTPVSELASASANDIAARNLYTLLSDTATMQAYGSTAASANSVIASANAAKPSYSNAIASASAALQSDNNEVSSVASSVAIDSILANDPSMSKLFESTTGAHVIPGHAGTKTTLADIAPSLIVKGDLKGQLNDNSVQSTLSSNLSMNGDANASADATTVSKALGAYYNKYHFTTGDEVVNAINGIRDVADKAAKSSNVYNYIQDNVLNDGKQDGQALAAGAGAAYILSTGDADAFDNANNNDELVGATGKIDQAFNNVLNINIPAGNATPDRTVNGSAVAGTGLLNPTSYASASNIVAGITNASTINSLNTSVANSYGNEQSASASYAKATDQDVTLANIYATSYSNDANSDASAESVAKNSLDNFYSDHADAKYANASSAASVASVAVPNDNALAYANGMHVYNYGPKYITVIKNAAIHTNANYGKFGDQKIANVPAGTKLTVLGDGFALNGGVVYHVNFKGNDGFITNLPDYVKQTYLNPGEVAVNVNQDSSVHSDANTWDKSTNVGVIKAGQTIQGTVYSVDGIRGGFTRMAFQYKGNTYYTSSNTDYVSLNDDAINNNNNGNNNVPSNDHVIFGA